jgi:hypothetical protein
MIAESLQLREMEDSLRNLLRLTISALALSQREERVLWDRISSSRALIFESELVFSCMSLLFCSMLVKLWLKEKSLSEV